ncbi:MAG: hypothetical protein A2252_02215 [Elusimicrobia bacterium RIFOXYA2_FULL_39_19]|nr:MAG: hypothetical protein A2252_02215 [Elusimicrobia bacterium RIFOXYA2_FULL_39_19]
MKTKDDRLCYWKWRKTHKKYLDQKVNFIVCGVYSGAYECNGLKVNCAYYRKVSVKDIVQAGKDKIKAKLKPAYKHY